MQVRPIFSSFTWNDLGINIYIISPSPVITKYYKQIFKIFPNYSLESLTSVEGRLSDISESVSVPADSPMSQSLTTHLNIIHQSDWSLVIITGKNLVLVSSSILLTRPTFHPPADPARQSDQVAIVVSLPLICGFYTPPLIWFNVKLSFIVTIFSKAKSWEIYYVQQEVFLFLSAAQVEAKRRGERP